MRGLSRSMACGMFPDQRLTRVSCTGMWILIHCTTRDVLGSLSTVFFEKEQAGWRESVECCLEASRVLCQLPESGWPPVPALPVPPLPPPGGACALSFTGEGFPKSLLAGGFVVNEQGCPKSRGMDGMAYSITSSWSAPAPGRLCSKMPVVTAGINCAGIQILSKLRA